MSPRGKRTLGIAACLATAALVVPQVVLLINRSLEPHYEGRGISSWMAQLAKDQVEAAEFQQTTNAIAHIGVPALPFLLKWLQHEHPRWKAVLAARTSGLRLPFAGDQLYYKWVTDRRPHELADATYFGFQALGIRAMPAFNELCQIMNNSKGLLAPDRAAMALSCLGTNALPLLLEAAANPQHPACMGAQRALWQIPEYCEAVTATASGAAIFLGMTNTQPTLLEINVLLNGKGLPQISIPPIAGYFGSRDSNAIPALAKALTDSEINVRRYATNALLQIAPQLVSNSPPQ